MSEAVKRGTVSVIGIVDGMGDPCAGGSYVKFAVSVHGSDDVTYVRMSIGGSVSLEVELRNILSALSYSA